MVRQFSSMPCLISFLPQSSGFLGRNRRRCHRSIIICRQTEMMRPFIGLLSFAIAMGMSGLSYGAEPLPLPKGPVVLTVSGKIERTNGSGVALFDMEMLEALGKASFATRSEVSEMPQLFEGVPLRSLLERIGAQGKSLRASALNDYVAVIPMED